MAHLGRRVNVAPVIDGRESGVRCVLMNQQRRRPMKDKTIAAVLFALLTLVTLAAPAVVGAVPDKAAAPEMQHIVFTRYAQGVGWGPSPMRMPV